VIFHHLRGKLLGGVVGFLLRELAGLDLNMSLASRSQRSKGCSLPPIEQEPGLRGRQKMPAQGLQPFSLTEGRKAPFGKNVRAERAM
jgi:hypothetical protein